MNRLLGLSLLILFGVSLSANAEVINVTATRTSFNATWDEVDLRVVSFTGISAQRVITIMVGTWTANGGAFSLPGNGTQWYKNISN